MTDTTYDLKPCVDDACRFTHFALHGLATVRYHATTVQPERLTETGDILGSSSPRTVFTVRQLAIAIGSALPPIIRELRPSSEPWLGAVEVTYPALKKIRVRVAQPRLSPRYFRIVIDEEL